MHCPISFWPPPLPPSLSNGDSGNLFGTFLPFPVQSNFHFELGCLSVIDAQNHHGKSFAAPKSRKCPFQHEKSCSKPSGQTGNAQIQKHQKGASFILLSYHCKFICLILSKIFRGQGNNDPNFFQRFTSDPRQIERNICGIEEPYSHTKSLSGMFYSLHSWFTTEKVMEVLLQQKWAHRCCLRNCAEVSTILFMLHCYVFFKGNILSGTMPVTTQSLEIWIKRDNGREI